MTFHEDEERCRLFYLKGQEWVVSSHEYNCISARNIAIFISRHVLGQDFKKSLNYFNQKENNFKNTTLYFVLFNFFGYIFHLITSKLN